MKTRSNTFISASETPWDDLGGGVRRQVLGYDGHVMAVKVEFQKGSVGAEHAHYHSQTSYVVSGKFVVTVAGESKTLSEGDGFFVAPDLSHGVTCLEAGVLLDVFSPHRADFLKR